MALLEVKNLKTSFFTPNGEVKAIDDISFNLEKGKVLGIVGESGSGKSVTAYSILQILTHPGKIVGGSIMYNGTEMVPETELVNDVEVPVTKTVDGVEVPVLKAVEKSVDIVTCSKNELREIRGNKISIIFQDPMTSLNPVYTVGNQLTEAILLHTDRSKEEAKARSIELLDLVGINEPEKRVKQYPFQLSGGMRQRIMIAMALACEPDILIADEPTTALDVTIQAQILELMQSLQSKLGMSIIMITHDLGVIAGMCDEVIVMYAGQICEQGTTDEIFYNPRHEYTKGLLRSIPSLHSDKKERLIPIGGTPIDMLNLPNGCAFAPRCEKCMKVCLAEKPEKRLINAEHASSCWVNDVEGIGEIIQREDNSND